MNDAGQALGFDERDFQRIRHLLRSWGGISLNDSKRPLVYNRLGKRLRAHGLALFHDYLNLVEENETEREHFINALTTNLTSFFREAHHFPILADYLQRQSADRNITIWCAAASTGEEPYSIAMTAIEALGHTAAQRVRIIASDLDTQVLAHGQTGIYRLDQLAQLPDAQRRQFFLKGRGTRTGYARIKQEVRELITFQQINLLADKWPLQGPLDIIFCRNVMIYFDKKTQLQILEKFAPILSADGMLLLGHSESLPHAGHLFRLCGRTLYRKVADKASS
ncbi:MAG: methylase of chemotaxis methyl-accepting protein [Proteobacteria bacterium]|nr:methylase of chemotaxis methyl-accepting protein [Pseudomonadota bacterium]